MNRSAHVRTDIVLVGGGHAHVHVLKAFGTRPVAGVRLTLITRDLETPYSGMLPGVIAGLYAPEEAHIDLARLTAATGARLINANAVGLDRAARRVLLADRPPIAYDLVSLDVGITPDLAGIEGAAEHAIAVKPIGSFLQKFGNLISSCRAVDGPRRIAIIGGGAGGVELLLSVRSRLQSEIPQSLSFSLITDGELLATHNERVRKTFCRALAERSVELHERAKVRAVMPGTVKIECGGEIAADAVLITTDAAPPSWFGDTGLELDPRGFVAVGPMLQSLNDPNVFAAGDCAALVETPREKAGVYAVRAGRPLAENLRRRALGEPLRDWRPQRRHLALISLGERYAVASRGAFKAEGKWLWTLKDWIDRRWMRMYQEADRMFGRMPNTSLVSSYNSKVAEMRCGGCAAKVGPGPLARTLKRLPPAPPRTGAIVVGLDAPDDAAVTVPPLNFDSVHSVDFFRAFIEDPYVFGEVAANHALNDILAMGGIPRHAMAIAVVPEGPPEKIEETLFQLLAGARACLDRESTVLIGGHSSEGQELAVGFSVTGEVPRNRILTKGGLTPGDALVLTRPIGTAVLFAAVMRAKARARWVDSALAEMRRSNRQAAAVLAAHGATAMTDVTGFGLIGHLGEMLAASLANAELNLGAIPLYEGALELARQGVASTLLPQNLALAGLLRSDPGLTARALLFDPQTSGGLLAGIPPDRVIDCVAELKSTGYLHAAVIGRVTEAASSEGQIGIATIGTLSG